MVVYEIDIRKNGLESAFVEDVNLGRELDILRNSGLNPTSLAQNAQLRIQEGILAKVSTKGNYVNGGVLYLRVAPGIVVKDSPFLTDESMLHDAIVTSIRLARNGGFFATPDNRLYESYMQMAQEDASKDPKDRRAIFLPSDKSFEISQKIHPELFRFLLEDVGEQYLNLVRESSLSFLPIWQESLQRYSGTVPKQLWFGNIRDNSSIMGNRELSDKSRTRGVKRII